MIRVVLLTRDGALCGFVSAGHAGYGEYGTDIVCAAVSALTQTCVNALESVAGVKPLVRRGEGFLAARLPKECESRDAQVLFLGLRQGLNDIAAQYPTYIRLTCRAESERRKHSC